MQKLYIDFKEKKRFSDLFLFLAKEKCKVFITDAGLDFRNDKSNGLICANAFVDFICENKKRITILDDVNYTKNWIKNWKELDFVNGKRDLIKIEL
mgnify:CR=1 FL=1